MRSLLFPAALCLSLISLPEPLHAGECGASLVTGIDVSGSVSNDELLMQLEGLTAALESPAVISAIQSVGCARMSVFLWGDQPPVVLLPWTDVGSPDQAAQASATLIAAASDYKMGPAQLTDVGMALAFAYQMLGQVPPNGRQVLNIISNGESNTGSGPQAIRQVMIDAGITINAMVFGAAPTLDQYYRTNVTGGRSSFVMRVGSADDFASAFRAKFRMDLAMVRP